MCVCVWYMCACRYTSLHTCAHLCMCETWIHIVQINWWVKLLWDATKPGAPAKPPTKQTHQEQKHKVGCTKLVVRPGVTNSQEAYHCSSSPGRTKKAGTNTQTPQLGATMAPRWTNMAPTWTFWTLSKIPKVSYLLHLLHFSNSRPVQHKLM